MEEGWNRQRETVPAGPSVVNRGIGGRRTDIQPCRARGSARGGNVELAANALHFSRYLDHSLVLKLLVGYSPRDTLGYGLVVDNPLERLIARKQACGTHSGSKLPHSTSQPAQGGNALVDFLFPPLAPNAFRVQAFLHELRNRRSLAIRDVRNGYPLHVNEP